MQNDEISRVREGYKKKIKQLEQQHKTDIVVIAVFIVLTVLGLIIAL